MKASQVIEKLQYLMEHLGDLDVTQIDADWGDTDDITDVVHKDGEFVIV